VADFQNLYFVKRLAGTAYGKVASRAQFSMIYRMLGHEYWIVQNAALTAIRRHGSHEDLKPLLEAAIAAPTECDGIVRAICLIDEKASEV